MWPLSMKRFNHPPTHSLIHYLALLKMKWIPSLWLNTWPQQFDCILKMSKVSFCNCYTMEETGKLFLINVTLNKVNWKITIAVASFWCSWNASNKRKICSFHSWLTLLSVAPVYNLWKVFCFLNYLDVTILIKIPDQVNIVGILFDRKYSGVYSMSFIFLESELGRLSSSSRQVYLYLTLC